MTAACVMALCVAFLYVNVSKYYFMDVIINLHLMEGEKNLNIHKYISCFVSFEVRLKLFV